MASDEPAAKRRRVWLSNHGRDQSVFLEEGDIADDLRRKAEPRMDDKELSFVRLTRQDGVDIDLFEAVPADVGVSRDTAVKVVVDPMPDAQPQVPAPVSPGAGEGKSRLRGPKKKRRKRATAKAVSGKRAKRPKAEASEAKISEGADAEMTDDAAEARDGERQITFVVHTHLPDLQDFQLTVPASTRMVDFRRILNQKVNTVATASLALFTDRHPLPVLDAESESKTLVELAIEPTDGVCELFAQPVMQEEADAQVEASSGSGTFYAAFQACAAWQPFQCKQSDAGLSCFLSSLCMMGKRLVSNDVLRRRVLGHFRAVSQSPPAVAALQAVMAGRPGTLRLHDKLALSSAVFLVLQGMLPADLPPHKAFERSRILFSMLLNRASDSDGGNEQWRVVTVASLDAEEDVAWLQRAEEQAVEDSGSVMGRAWLHTHAVWLKAAWPGCGEVALWFGPSSTSPRRSCLYPMAALQGECGRGEASFLQLVAAQVLGRTVHPCLTRGPKGKVVVCSGMPPCSAGDVLLFDPLSGEELSKCPHQLAREVRQQQEAGGAVEDEASLATRAASEAVVICLDTSRSMGGDTGFEEDSEHADSDEDDLGGEGWDETEPEDDSPAALDDALRKWRANPNFLVFQQILASDVPAVRAGKAALILEELLRVERMKGQSSTNFVRLATKHKATFVQALQPSLALAEPANEDAPPAFRCAITHDVMDDPVVAADGFSYEREAILQWFRLPGPVRSPMTGGVLASEELTSNQNLKNQITEWRDATSVRQHPRAFSIFYRGQLQGTQAVWPGMLVETLRQRSAERLRASPSWVRLQLRGSRLRDGQRLVEDCGLARDDTVNVTVDFGASWESLDSGAPVAISVTTFRRSHEFRIAGSMNMSSQTLLFRLWALGLASGNFPRQPSQSTLWANLVEAGDGIRQGHPLEYSESIGLFAKEKALCDRFKREVKLDWGPLYKAKTGQELTRLSCVKQLLESFLNRVQAFSLPVDIGLLVFSSEVSLTCAPTAFSEDFRDEVQRAKPSGDTALYDAVDKAADALEAWQAKQSRGPDAKPALRVYVLSDGSDTKSSLPCWRVARRLQKAGIVLDAVHVGSCGMDDQLHSLAKCTGGYVFQPKSIQEAVRLHELEVVLHGPDRAPETRARPIVESQSDLRKFGPRFYPVDRSDDGALPARRQPQQLTRRAIPLETAIRQTERQHDSGDVSKDSTLEAAPDSNPSNPGNPEASAPRRADRQRRLLREMRALMRQPHPNFDVYPCDEDLSFWRLVLAMDQEADLFTPYASGAWLLYVLFPADYPERPPEVRFVTSIKHCNVNAYGRICHSILDRNYTTDTAMTEVLQSVYGLILSPEKEDAIDVSLALQCHNDPESYRRAIVRHVQDHASKTRSSWREALEQGEVGTPAMDLDVRTLGPGTSLAELREFIAKHRLPIITSGAGRTRAAVLKDIYEHAARQQRAQRSSQD